jgi:Methyltransferase domain
MKPSLYRRLINKIKRVLGLSSFRSTHDYWESRYKSGGSSGAGSGGKFAVFKAEILNRFVAEHGIQSVIEFGSGDGQQLGLAKYPKYLGIDLSQTAIAMCREIYRNDPTKAFLHTSEYKGHTADLALSLDVIYHLVEDEVFEAYMRQLAQSANQYIIIYSSDTEDNKGYEGTHVRLRSFTGWVARNMPSWKLIEHIPNKYPFRGDYTDGSWSDFYIYQKQSR